MVKPFWNELLLHVAENVPLMEVAANEDFPLTVAAPDTVREDVVSELEIVHGDEAENPPARVAFPTNVDVPFK